MDFISFFSVVDWGCRLEILVIGDCFLFFSKYFFFNNLGKGYIK